MYIVVLREQKHSAWNTWEQAQKQVEVLKEHGYRHIKIKFETDIEYLPNGYYFI